MKVGQISVVDPWHVGTDLDPQSRTIDLRIRIRILLFRQLLTSWQE
jgi:hypothetical protein